MPGTIGIRLLQVRPGPHWSSKEEPMWITGARFLTGWMSFLYPTINQLCSSFADSLQLCACRNIVQRFVQITLDLSIYR